MDHNPDGASPKEQTLFAEIRPYLRPDVRIQDIERESKTRRKRREVAQALRENGWYSKKDAQGYVRWYPHAAVPKDHRLRGNSTRFGRGGAAGGEIDQQWVKTERESDEPKIPRIPDNFAVKRVATMVDGKGEVRAQWSIADKRQQTQFDEFYAAINRANARYVVPVAAAEPPARNWDDSCIIYPLGDAHVGMLSWAKETGEDFDLRIAERDLFSVVDLLAEQAPAAPRAILVNVGDYFHADDFKQVTPGHGHSLDCDSRIGKIIDVGFNLERRLIDRLLQRHKTVEVVNVPGNHDPMLSRMLGKWISAVYEREPRVIVHPNDNMFLYLTHGKNVWGFTHGNSVKPQELPAVMAEHDHGELWGQHPHRKWFTGHVHHEQVKEYRGCTVETFNTLAARDAWHHEQGYRSKRFLSYIVFDKIFGERARAKVPLDMARWHKQS